MEADMSDKRGEILEQLYKLESENFVCPVCGSTKFESHSASNRVMGPGGRSWTAYNKCNGCSVLFLDPIAFTTKRTEITEEAHRLRSELESYS